MKTFKTEKGNIPEGATHYRDECKDFTFVWVKLTGNKEYVWDVDSWYETVVINTDLEITPIPQTNIETPEEKEALDSMKQSNRQSEMCRPLWAKWSIGDTVTKTKGSSWTGKVVGYYQTDLTSKGYAVESSTEKGSVQIYPEAALCDMETPQQREERERANAIHEMCASVDSFTQESHTWAGKLYDLGYRKEG